MSGCCVGALAATMTPAAILDNKSQYSETLTLSPGINMQRGSHKVPRSVTHQLVQPTISQSLTPLIYEQRILPFFFYGKHTRGYSLALGENPLEKIYLWLQGMRLT